MIPLHQNAEVMRFSPKESGEKCTGSEVLDEMGAG